jgi:2'-5' RNA ligase
MREYFVGIPVPAAAEGILLALQARAQKELRTYPGCGALTLSHGKSPLHLTLLAPFTPSPEAHLTRLEDGLTQLAKNLTPFTLTLTTLMTLGRHTIAFAVHDRAALHALRTAAHTYTRRQAPRESIPHVSIARKFSQEHFHEVQEACARAFCEYSAHFPLSFAVRGITLFGKEGDRWAKHITYHLKERSAVI